MTFAEKIQAAKDLITIPELWRIVGYEGTPRVGQVCRAPWRDDKHPSFSLTKDGRLFNDFAGKGGDAITFLELALNIPRRDAMFKLLDIAGGGNAIAHARTQKPLTIYRRRKGPDFPSDLHVGSQAELQSVADLRGLSLRAVQAASDLELLWFCKWDFVDCWLLTDSTRVIGQVRRMDGQPINEVKAHTIYGSWAQWPVGAANIHRSPMVALCEGGPDLLAACQFIIREAVHAVPVCMLGASPAISTGAVPLFHRKHVVIFQHNEKPKPVLNAATGVWTTPEFSAGQIAATRWKEQLLPVAASVRIHQFPDGIKDLNDLAKTTTDMKVMTI